MEHKADEDAASEPSKDADDCSPRSEAHAPKSPQARTSSVATNAGTTSSIELPDDVVRRLREQFGVKYECWFAKVKVISVDNKNGILTLSATGPFVRDWMQSQYESHVLDAWNAARRIIGGPRITRVEFRTVRHGPTS